MFGNSREEEKGFIIADGSMLFLNLDKGLEMYTTIGAKWSAQLKNASTTISKARNQRRSFEVNGSSGYKTACLTW
jgi:hypothetical protein